MLSIHNLSDQFNVNYYKIWRAIQSGDIVPDFIVGRQYLFTMSEELEKKCLGLKKRKPANRIAGNLVK